MKKTDIAMVILISTVCVLVAFFVTRSIMGSSATETTKVKTIEKIESEIVEPDTSIFNSEAINPAVKVQINDGAQQ